MMLFVNGIVHYFLKQTIIAFAMISISECLVKRFSGIIGKFYFNQYSKVKIN